MEFDILLFKYVLLVLAILISSVHGLTSGCRFQINRLNQDFPNILDTRGASFPPKFDLNTNKPFVEVNAGSRFKLRCPDANDFIRFSERNEANAVCVRGTVIRVADVPQDFTDLRCDRERDLNKDEAVYRNGTCFNDFTNIEIALIKFRPAYSLITVCHNEWADETLYVRSQIRGADLSESENTKRPNFKEGGFFKEIDANRCYSTPGQTETLGILLGSADLAEHYIQPKLNLFLARGHLSPNADGIESYEKRATFYYLNTVPQWQSINGGNWNQLESAARRVAAERETTLTVYTGAYGVTTLDDVNNNPVELWLGRAKNGSLVRRLPVPHLMWKVLYDEEENDGVAIIQINNPWRTVRRRDILCEDVCDELPWVKWKVHDIKQGFTYCCDLASFRKAIPYAPDLGDIPLLT